MTTIPFKPNHRTNERRLRERQATRQRLIAMIGVRNGDGPLFNDELRARAYGNWLWQEALDEWNRITRPMNP